MKGTQLARCGLSPKNSRLACSCPQGRVRHSDKINLTEKLATFSEYWSPRTVAQLNAHDVMVVKVKGEFVWHKHDETDDFFLVLKGKLDIQLRDRRVSITVVSRKRKCTCC